MPMDERYTDIHGEIIYNNLARQDAWYLSLMGDAFVEFTEIILSTDYDDFEIYC